MLIFTVYEFDMQYMQIQACLIVFQYCQYFDYTSKSPIPFKTHRKLKMVHLSSRNKHTISYHVQSSLNFELDLKISWCHGLISRYLVPKKWWRTFPEYHKIWYWEKSFEINKNVKLVHVLQYISVQQRFFKICFQTALSLLVNVWGSLTFDH